MLEEKSFESSLKYNDIVKPILFIRCDGGPDENVRHPKVIRSYVQIFQIHDLDAVFAVMMPPGHSAYNPCERRMAPLSRDLCGIVLDHEHFGSHLDKNAKTIDEELEKRNFKHCGECLRDIWNETIIDNYEIKASWRDAMNQDELELQYPPIDPQWYALHIRQGYYCLQIVKCQDVECCKPFRSPLLSILERRFLPTPKIYMHDIENGKIVLHPTNQPIKQGCHFASLLTMQTMKLGHEKNLPIDTYNGQFNENDILLRTCRVDNCGLCFPTITALKEHHRGCHFRQRSGAIIDMKVDDIEMPFHLDLTGAIDIIDEQRGEYLVKFEDEHCEWMSLNENHQLVDQYKTRLSTIPSLEPIPRQQDVPDLEIISESELATWCSSPWIFEH